MTSLHPASGLSRPPGAPDLAGWLDLLNAALPRQVFGAEANRDVQQLASLARTLLCLPDLSVLDTESRLHRVMGALLGHPLWEDLLVTNPDLIHPVLPTLHLWARRWPLPPGTLRPVQRALDAGLLTRAEWTPMHRLDLSVHLHGLQAAGLDLGGAALPAPREAASRTVLPVQVPTWLWCYEKVSVLHYLLRAGSSAGLVHDPSWTRTTAAGLVHALRAPDMRALSDHALAHALSPGADPALLRRALDRGAALLAGQPDSARWVQPVTAAHLAVVAALLSPSPPSGEPPCVS